MQYYLFYFLGKLIGQPVEKEPKTYFFGLIKTDSDSPYEDGYWLNKWFFQESLLLRLI